MKKIFIILTFLLTLMISSTAGATRGDIVQLVDIGASTFVSKLNSNNINISVSEPVCSSNEGPYDTAIYTSNIYNSSSYYGEITFWVNGSGYVTAMIIEMNANNEKEKRTSYELLVKVLSVIGLNSQERSVLFDVAQKNNGKGCSLSSATSRFINTAFEIKSNKVYTMFTAQEL